MLVEQISVGPMANFVYLVVEESSKEAMVVDSGWETGPVEKAVLAARARVEYVVATHEHFDHTSTIPQLADALNAKTVAHRSSPLDCELRVEGGDKIRLGPASVSVLHTPGHTEDSICLYDGSHVFTGDTLFVGTIGKFERGKEEEIYTSLHEVILKLPPQTVLYPGHDYGEVKARSLGEESRLNPFLAPRDLKGFESLFS
jgi:hydroxyacylglutathione hydrolase